MIKSPLFSLITVVYNGARYLEETIQSVLQQDYQHIEYIIIDGGSTDGSLEIIKKYENQLTYWVSEPYDGIYHAMNEGIQQATGDLIGFLNADDYLLPGSLERVADRFVDTLAHIFYGNQLLVWESNGEQLSKKCVPNVHVMKKKMGIFHPASYVRRDVFSELGLFDESLKLAGDYEFMLRAYLSRYTFCYVDTLITAFRLGGRSSSFKVYLEGYRIQRRYRLPYSNRMLFSLIKRSLKYFVRNYVLKPLRIDIVMDEHRKEQWRSTSEREWVISK